MKTKNRNLLTVILAVLCAAAVALGIGLILPKAEKINANAAVACNAEVIGGGVVSGAASETQWTPGYMLSETTYDNGLHTSESRVSIKMVVPAYTEYTVSYAITVRVLLGNVAPGSGTVTGSATARRYADASYGTVKQTSNTASGTGTTKDEVLNDQPFNVNLIFTNDKDKNEDFVTYFDLTLTDLVKYKTATLKAVFYLDLDSSTVEATKLSKPTTNDTLEMDYDEKPHTVNVTYADEVDSTDVDDKDHSYTTGYKNVKVTVEAKDFDGKAINDYTITPENLSEATGSVSLTATNAGTYTIKFELTSSAKSNGIEWDGNADPITLTINKVDPKVNPKVGKGPWYTTNDLVKDIKIETSEGDTDGKISWDASQTLSSGTKNYGWTFKPTDSRNYNDKSDTESITVEGLKITGIEAEFEQDGSVFYTSDSLDSLKANLVVTKKYNDEEKDEVITDPSLYTLSVPGNKLTEGTVTVTVKYRSGLDETPAKASFEATFEVEITAVELESVKAEFDPNGNDIYLSNSLSDLNQYLTVTGTYNDGSTKTLTTSDYSLTDPAALSLGNVTVTVTSTEDNNITDTFNVNVIPDIVPVALPLPETNPYTYSGEELDAVGALTTLTDEQVVKYLDVSGTATARRAGEYTAKFKIKDEFINAGTVSWDTSNLSSLDGVTVSADGNSVEFKWTILKAKIAATWDEEECVWVPVIVGTLAETTEPDFLNQTYTNSDGKAFTNRSKLAGGRTYQVTAAINAKYADNFELDEPTQTLINSGSETYTYTPEYKPSIWEKIVAFFKANWLWFVIALAAIILLIIIIVVAKKCHKTKEQKEEIKARKEEERRRKEEERLRREEERRLQQERLEEERRLQREKLEAEREMARAKQEAELEKIRAQAQAGLAGAGMASMAMAQPQQQAMPVPQVQTVDNELLKEMRQQMAELRADNKATQAQLQAMQNNQQQAMQMPQPMQYQQYPQYPYQQMPMMPQYGGNDLAMARMEAQLNAMQAEQRARYDAEQRIELAAMRAESHVDRDSRHSVDLAAMREHINGHNYNRVPDYSQQSYNQPNSMDMMGALVAATLRNMANGELAVTQSVPELPQKTEQSPQSAKYPSDAVITTTTTVDTTKNKPIRREDEFDVDGFYDTFE